MTSRPHLPHVFQAAQIMPTMESVIAKFQNMHEAMVQTVTPSTACFANTFEPWARVANETQCETGMIYLLGYAAADKETKDASYEARKLFNAAEAAWMSRNDIFILLQAAANKDEDLDSESRHWVEAKMRDFTISGHGLLDDLALHTFIQQRSNIDELKEKYNRNLMEESDGLWMGQEELDGVPEEELQKWRQGSGTNEGKYFVPFANGGSKIVLSHACREITRKKMFLAEEAKVPENVELLREIACLRDSQARLLGYESHGALRIEGRAIKSVNYVEQLLGHLKESLIPLGKQELKHLQELRIETLNKNGAVRNIDDDKFPPWDLTYYKRLTSLAAKVDDQLISEYFPLGPTVAGMLNIFESVLMLRFVQIPPDQLDGNSRWHESVQIWETWDNTNNEFIGFLYFDLLWREHKYRGSQNVNIHCGFLKQNGTRHKPATTLMCGFPQPSEFSCALLKHNEVVTLFHELGHGIHDLVSKTKFVRFHGTRLPVDFGEMPSFLLENWCWMKDTLGKLSCHYTTIDSRYLTEWRATHVGEPDPPTKIPDSLLANLIEARYLNRCLWFLHQLSVSIFDLKIHNPASHEQIANMDFQKLWYDIREEIEGIEFAESRENGHEHVTFGHLLSGYDMGYYGYLSCSSIAQDIFHTFFKENPWSRDAWKRYREGILELGGSQQDQIKVLKAFLGREPDFHALTTGLTI